MTKLTVWRPRRGLEYYSMNKDLNPIFSFSQLSLLIRREFKAVLNRIEYLSQITHHIVVGNAYLVVTECMITNGKLPNVIRMSPCGHRIMPRALSELLARTHGDVIVIRQPKISAQ